MMTDRDGGSLLPQKASNGHLPSFLASTCLAFVFLTKVFASILVYDYLPFLRRNHLPSPGRNHLPLGFLLTRGGLPRFLFCWEETYARMGTWYDWITA